jgi:YVTN family beta-propeller protein
MMRVRFSLCLALVFAGFLPARLAAQVTSLVVAANENDDTVSIIDASTRTVVGTVPVGDLPFGTAMSRDGRRAYVSNINGNTVSVIDLMGPTVETTITGFDGPAAWSSVRTVTPSM